MRTPRSPLNHHLPSPRKRPPPRNLPRNHHALDPPRNRPCKRHSLWPLDRDLPSPGDRPPSPGNIPRNRRALNPPGNRPYKRRGLWPLDRGLPSPGNRPPSPRNLPGNRRSLDPTRESTPPGADQALLQLNLRVTARTRPRHRPPQYRLPPPDCLSAEAPPGIPLPPARLSYRLPPDALPSLPPTPNR